jgi:hypothetical protein
MTKKAFRALSIGHQIKSQQDKVFCFRDINQLQTPTEEQVCGLAVDIIEGFKEVRNQQPLEQLVLHVRALHVLSSALVMAQASFMFNRHDSSYNFINAQYFPLIAPHQRRHPATVPSRAERAQSAERKVPLLLSKIPRVGLPRHSRQ